ncbi:hypothetical protein GBA52_002759 [Prunus armeniaca]|nr:hypothetical protein GBA52_002759 [Prunus armeniaca]
MSFSGKKAWISRGMDYGAHTFLFRIVCSSSPCGRYSRSHSRQEIVTLRNNFITPKSGITWLKAVLFALVKRVHYPDPQQHPLLTNNPHVLVPFLELNVLTSPAWRPRGSFRRICHMCLCLILSKTLRARLFTCVEILRTHLFLFGTSPTN